MANLAPKIINLNFNYLIVSVRRPSHTCASFFCMFVTGFFCQRHRSHDSPADVVFYFTLAVQFFCVLFSAVYVFFVYVYVYVYLQV